MIKISTVEKIVFSFLLFTGAMLLLRITYANNLRYVFLMWNLFLAWIPFQLGLFISAENSLGNRSRFFLLGIWLLFFPNALYIITDLIHLGYSNDRVPLWFDAVLLFISALTGLIMAFVSLYQVEKFLQERTGVRYIKTWIVAILFAGSFGVYLGRFLRWNSWDIIANPVSLLYGVLARCADPVLHYRTWAITVLLTCFFCLLYFALRMLPGLYGERKLQ